MQSNAAVTVAGRSRSARLPRRAAALALLVALGTVVGSGPHAVAAGPAGGTGSSAQTRPDAGHLRHVATVTARPRLVAPAPAPAPAPVSEAQAYQQRLLELVNAERGRRGLHPLALAPCADGFADRWADSMAARDVMEHQPLGPVLDACHAHAVAENVAYGTVSADRMMQMWMDSPGHRTNILRPEMTHIGIGSTRRGDGRVYGCQVFLDLV